MLIPSVRLIHEVQENDGRHMPHCREMCLQLFNIAVLGMSSDTNTFDSALEAHAHSEWVL